MRRIVEKNHNPRITASDGSGEGAGGGRIADVESGAITALVFSGEVPARVHVSDPRPFTAVGSNGEGFTACHINGDAITVVLDSDDGITALV
ncbi:unnamed protein product [Linum trigynum]|uniref:Uncharacterized protein n=1 Tax=Linum trigynum TaxID=586398 RepID=A0AAV2F2I6_9ROSI